MKKSLFAVLAFLTLLTGCFKSENTNTVSTDGSTSMEKVIGILGEVFTENNKFIGGIALELLQSNPQITETFGDNVADLGWILDKNYWNHGFVTEAAFAVVKLAKSLGYKKLIAQCDKDNIGSYRVMEKIGMTLFSNDGVRFNKCEPNVPKTELMYTMDL